MILKLQTKVQRASCVVKSYCLALIAEAAATFNHLTPNGHFSGPTAPLTYICCIFFYLFNRNTY
jgi:hypothetical protein